VAVDSCGLIKLNDLFAYDISPKWPLLGAGVSLLLSDGCAVSVIL